MCSEFAGSEHDESRTDLPPSPGSSTGKPRRPFAGRSKAVDPVRPFKLLTMVMITTMMTLMVTQVITVTKDHADVDFAL